MALLFVDSFDHYVTADMLEKWSTKSDSQGPNTIVGAAGRRSSGGYRRTHANHGISYLSKAFPTNANSCTLGFAIKISKAPDNDGPLFAFMLGGTQQVSVCANPGTPTLRVKRGRYHDGTFLGDTSGFLPIGSFTFVEIKVVFSTTVGTVDIRLNGANVLSLTGLNTANSGTAFWSAISFGQPDTGFGLGQSNWTVDIDDLYICDGSGPAPWNTFLGDVRVDYHIPNANGTNNASTPSTGTDRYVLVDETSPNDDTDYTTLLAAGDKDTYNIEAMKAAGTSILGIQTLIAARKIDTGVATLCPVIRHSSVDYDDVTLGLGPPVTVAVLSGSYFYFRQIYTLNPATGDQFLEPDFNAMEFGMKRVT